MSTSKVRVPPFQFEYGCPENRLAIPRNHQCKMRKAWAPSTRTGLYPVLGPHSVDCGGARTRYSITFVPSRPNPRVACIAIISGVYLPVSNATINGFSSDTTPVKLSEAQ